MTRLSAGARSRSVKLSASRTRATWRSPPLALTRRRPASGELARISSREGICRGRLLHVWRPTLCGAHSPVTIVVQYAHSRRGPQAANLALHPRSPGSIAPHVATLGRAMVSDRATGATAVDETPEWWPYAPEFPHWHVWRGVAGLLYARRPRSSPPKVVRGKDLTTLREGIISAEVPR